MIKYTVQYGVSAVLLSMLTNRFLHKRVLPCVCISGPPHRLLCKERKGFISLIYTFYGLYAQAAVLQALRLMIFSLYRTILKKMDSPSPTIPRTSNLFITLPMSGIFMKSKDAEVVHVWAVRSGRPEDGTEIGAWTGHCSKNLLPAGHNAFLIIHTHWHTFLQTNTLRMHTHLLTWRERVQRFCIEGVKQTYSCILMHQIRGISNVYI